MRPSGNTGGVALPEGSARLALPPPALATDGPGKELTGGADRFRPGDWSGPLVALRLEPRIRGDGGGAFFDFGAGAGVERKTAAACFSSRSVGVTISVPPADSRSTAAGTNSSCICDPHPDALRFSSSSKAPRCTSPLSTLGCCSDDAAGIKESDRADVDDAGGCCGGGGGGGAAIVL